MSDTENSCRICRGEGTSSQPLLHPCKCRGSIRYIHQDCLLEWLKHSNKSTEQCDICNAPYKFRTIYDESMPSKIPFNVICSKLLSILNSTSILTLSVILYFFCLIIQVPIFWKFISRLFTYIVDGHLPNRFQTFTQSLFFGNIVTILRSEDIKKVGYSAGRTFDNKSSWFKFVKFFDFTYFSGARYFVVFAFINLALFIEHEWVVRDDGYSKLLLQKIGKEPRTKLVDMLQQALNGLRNDGANGNADANENLQRVQNLARAINDLQDRQVHNNREEALRRAIEENFLHVREEAEEGNGEPARFGVVNRDPLHLHINGAEAEADSDADAEAEDNDEDNESVDEHQNQNPLLFAPPVAHQQDENAHFFAPPAAVDEPLFVPAAPQPDLFDDTSDSEDEGANRLNQAPAEERDAAAAANIQGRNLFDLLGFSLNLTTPLLLMILCDVIIAVYLVFVYLVPHMLGNTFVSAIELGLRTCGLPLINYVTSSRLFSTIQNDYLPQTLETGNYAFDLVVLSVNEIFVTPVTECFRNIFLRNFSHGSEFHNLSLTERIIILGFGHGLIALIIHRCMNSLTLGKKPVVGTSRVVFEALFEASSTLKVFIIFSIEIFFFPVYCGWLLDFCAAPLLLEEFLKSDPVTGKIQFNILFSSSVGFLQINYVRVFLYWVSGTLYMLLFALFVGMARSKILRPGVLFFIRSPDDPNARLIHDALVKPFMLQLSRIYLSAKVYTGFILVGIGGVTWGLRYLITPTVPNAKTNRIENVMLPIQPTNAFIMLFSILLLKNINRDLVTNYCRKYWSKAFEISCHKLRLSHFILGKPISQERGYILYRNIWYQLLSVGLPDFSKPVTYKQALNIFKQEKDVIACFIPDGSFVRAPDNDTVSRKFIKKLFVPVTKDDKLISPQDDTTVDNNSNIYAEYGSDSSEDELNNDNAYTIVYRPPNFKTRCFLLILMLWTFAIILILSLTMFALMIGRPFSMLLSCLPTIPIPLFTSGDFTSGLIKAQPLNGRLADLPSILIGLRFEYAFLLMADRAIERKKEDDQQQPQPPAGHGDGANEEEIEPNLLREVFNTIRERLNLTLIGSMVSIPLWTIFFSSTHKIFVEVPINYFRGSNNKIAYLAHVVVGVWTVMPLVTQYRYSIRHLTANAPLTEGLKESGLISTLLLFGLLHLPYLIILGFRYHFEGTPFVFDRKDMIIRLILILVITILKFSSGGYDTYKKLEEQIKNERYVKGRAIENVELSDED